jgi:hypothetical protein
MKLIDEYHIYISVIAVFCLCFLYGTRVSAGGSDPCTEDIAKFCKDVKHGGVMDCLEQHENELSDACRTFEQKIGGKKIEMREEVSHMKLFRDACNEDMGKFCQDIKPEQGGIEKCLSEHGKELSTPCRERLKAAGEERMKGNTR